MKKESKKKRDERIGNILAALDAEYGTEMPCALNHRTPWELLVATMLSAQCTDARVNMVTPSLFEKYPDVKSFAEADQAELEEAIHSTGFYHNKARNIIACAGQLLRDHGGEVPHSLEELTGLAGVGRKTANVIRGHIYNEPSIVVDTHVKRISRLLGLTDTDDPVKAEFELMELLPEDHWILWNTDIITLGRTVCIANRPRCGACILAEFCPSAKIC